MVAQARHVMATEPTRWCLWGWDGVPHGRNQLELARALPFKPTHYYAWAPRTGALLVSVRCGGEERLPKPLALRAVRCPLEFRSLGEQGKLELGRTDPPYTFELASIKHDAALLLGRPQGGLMTLPTMLPAEPWRFVLDGQVRAFGLFGLELR